MMVVKRNKQGELNCPDGPAIIRSNGSKEWWLHGKRHRIDGPAVESSVQNEWWFYGKRHRAYGPAIKGNISESHYIHGIKQGAPVNGL